MDAAIKTREYKQKLEQALKLLSRFLTKLPSEGPRPSSELPVISFSVPELGGIEIRGKTADAYQRCVKQMINAVSIRQDIDGRSVEASIQVTILKVISGSSVEPVIKDLQNSLYSAPYESEVFQPLVGIDADGLPITIGKIEFLNLDENLVSTLVSKIDSILREDHIQHREVAVAYTKDSLKSLKSAVVAHSHVYATDHGAARSAAEGHLREVIHVINCYSSLLYFRRSGAFLLGEGGGAISYMPVFSDTGKTRWSDRSEWRGAFIPVRLKYLFNEQGKRSGFARVNEILRSDARTTLETRILSTFHWAGRASVEHSREVAFLFYMIALESLLLGNRNKGDLGFRLKTRCALLLGSDLTAKIEIADTVARLYQVRSALVHAGSSTSITDAEVSSLEKYVKTCLKRILVDSPFVSFCEEDELDNWFEQETLK